MGPSWAGLQGPRLCSSGRLRISPCYQRSQGLYPRARRTAAHGMRSAHRGHVPLGDQEVCPEHTGMRLLCIPGRPVAGSSYPGPRGGGGPPTLGLTGLGVSILAGRGRGPPESFV